MEAPSSPFLLRGLDRPDNGGDHSLKVPLSDRSMVRVARLVATCEGRREDVRHGLERVLAARAEAQIAHAAVGE